MLKRILLTLGLLLALMPAAVFESMGVEGNEVYRGRKRWLDEPIATIHGNEVYEGRRGWADEPIATVGGGGRMSAAAVYLLLM